MDAFTSGTVTLPPEEGGFLEIEVLGLRLWMILGVVMLAFSVVIIVLCCIFDIRIPRTKQVIEADHEQQRLVKQYRQHVKGKLAKGHNLRNLKIIRGPPGSSHVTNVPANQELPPVPSPDLHQAAQPTLVGNPPPSPIHKATGKALASFPRPKSPNLI